MADGARRKETGVPRSANQAAVTATRGFFYYAAEESKVEGFNGETTMTRIPGEVIKALNGQKVPLALSSSTRGESP